MSLDAYSIEELKDILAQYQGLEHLRVKKRGKSLTIYSHDGDETHNHAKLTAIGRNLWGLSLTRHTGRWEKTPFTGTMSEVVSILVDNLGFHLQDWTQLNI